MGCLNSGQQQDAGIEKQNDDTSKSATDIPFRELGDAHQALLDKYKDVNPEEVKEDPFVKSLMAFNGYYQMSTGTAATPGAFLTIDTNIVVIESIPIHEIDIILSIDGVTSNTYTFNGTFENNKLKMNGSITLDLDFNHTSADATIASFTGTITSNDNPTPYSVKGYTYNNPIPYSVYFGDYFHTTSVANKTSVKVMTISDKYQLEYDYDSNDGTVQKVPFYVYNVNMYFFSFTNSAKTQGYRLIMGSAAAGGFACNNITIDITKGKMTGDNSRSLQTISFPDEEPNTVPNTNSGVLAPFSGYYGITADSSTADTVTAGAFVSIQAEYTLSDNKQNYKVLIGISADGKKSTSYIFNETMSFKNGTLTMPGVLTADLARNYDSDSGTVANLNNGSITINNTQVSISGVTYFNPVPLSGFPGKYYRYSKKKNEGKSTKQMILNVINDSEVTFNGTTLESFIYVPIMYILYQKVPGVEMSFGTNGKAGNACIITTKAGIQVAEAIPSIPN